MTTNTNRLADVSQQSADDCAAVREILAGLSLPQKTLSPKFFYDERGSELFEEITRLPEYYLTGTERRIMRTNIGAIADLVGEHASLIEFGAGSNEKIRLLLKHLHNPAVYVPVDISADYLAAAAEDLAQDFPHIEILPLPPTSRGPSICQTRASHRDATSFTFRARRSATFRATTHSICSRSCI